MVSILSVEFILMKILVPKLDVGVFRLNGGQMDYVARGLAVRATRLKKGMSRRTTSAGGGSALRWDKWHLTFNRPYYLILKAVLICLCHSACFSSTDRWVFAGLVDGNVISDILVPICCGSFGRTSLLKEFLAFCPLKNM